MQVCTVITRNRVAQARVLAESLRAHDAEAQLTVLVVDPLDGLIDPQAEPFAVLQPAALEVEDLDAMAVRYTAMGLCAALKPWLVRHLIADSQEPAVLMDADMSVYGPLGEVLDAHPNDPLLLTPHLLQPLPDDGKLPEDLTIVRAGPFNSGFLVASPGPEADAVLRWWAERLRTMARGDTTSGAVYDQVWVSLFPGLARHVGVCRDPGVNFGYWRAPVSTLDRSDGVVHVDGRPLRCIHFSGFDPSDRARLSRYENRRSRELQPVLDELCDEYAQRLLDAGDEQARRWPYGYAATASGVPLDTLLRRLWETAHDEGVLASTPFQADGEEHFLEWLAEPAPVKGAPLGNYLQALHAATPVLRERFPEPRGRDREAFLAWAEEQAERDPDGIAGRLGARRASVRRSGLRTLARGERLGAERGETVVCIPVFGASELFAECLASVLDHTEPEVPILIADDAGPDPAVERFLASLADAGRLAGHELALMRQPHNVGFPLNVNAAFAAAAPADVVVLNSDCVVAAGWLAGLRRAAYSDELVATASALSNHGTLLSVPERNRERPDLPQNVLLPRAASAVLAQSLRIYPKLPTAVGHCVFVRRHALDLVGDFDPAFSPGYGEEVDFSQRCLLVGLVHVAADDVLVLHHGGGSLREEGEINPLRAEHERIIEARYPYYQRTQTAAGQAGRGPLPRALASARRAIVGMTATIDGRCLGPIVTGTQVHTLEVIRGLSRTGRMRLRVIVPPDLHPDAAALMGDLDDVELLSHEQVRPDMTKSELAHRPYQVTEANDLELLRCAGERTMITHQDLIAYENPGYFPGYRRWARYRRLTRQALALADGVVFISQHAADTALKEELVDYTRSHVIHNGVDHHAIPSAVPTAPDGVEVLGERPMLLCLGTDFAHKNRLFALRLLQALREERGWEGMLVLAGPKVSYGSSAPREQAFLALHPELAEAVVRLPAVEESHKRWLFERAQALLYPTTYEGFGLMPFEAADHGRPCLFAAHTALAEILPPELATLVPWDPAASAIRSLPLLSDPQAAAAQVRGIRRAGERYTWTASSEMLAEAYFASVASPTREATRIAGDLVETERELAEAERKYNELWSSLTPDARALVAPDGPLTPETTHSLAAVARRPLLRGLLFGPMKLASRIARGRSGAAEPAPETTPDTFALHFGYANQEHMREQLQEGDAASLATER